MKKILTFAIVLSVFAAAPLFAEGEHEGKDFGAKKVEKMKEKLSLSDEQASQVKSILDSGRDKMKALRDEIDGQIVAVLTPEQKANYEAMKKEFKDKMAEKHAKKNE
jgi:Spy/CpxP family protein refolding chaperone